MQISQKAKPCKRFNCYKIDNCLTNEKAPPEVRGSNLVKGKRNSRIRIGNQFEGGSVLGVKRHGSGSQTKASTIKETKHKEAAGSAHQSYQANAKE